MLLPNIKKLRIQHDYTEEFISNYINYSIEEYRHIETVDSKMITFDQIIRLGTLYNISYKDVVKQKGEEID